MCRPQQKCSVSTYVPLHPNLPGNTYLRSTPQPSLCTPRQKSITEAPILSPTLLSRKAPGSRDCPSSYWLRYNHPRFITRDTKRDFFLQHGSCRKASTCATPHLRAGRCMIGSLRARSPIAIDSSLCAGFGSLYLVLPHTDYFVPGATLRCAYCLANILVYLFISFPSSFFPLENTSLFLSDAGATLYLLPILFGPWGVTCPA